MSENSGERDAERCHVETLADGTRVRVNGSINRDALEVIAAQVRERFESECHDLSPYLMPAIAQRIHERETYWCGRPKGHDGPHRWGSREWPTAPAPAHRHDRETTAEEADMTNDVLTNEPTEPGWYTYSGGAEVMIFHLREHPDVDGAGARLQWSAHFDNGTAADCEWGYIEQALGVWDLVPLALTTAEEAEK